MGAKTLKTCDKCLFTDQTLEIQIGEDGICNFCKDADDQLPYYRFSSEDEMLNLDRLSKSLKSHKKRQYDCIIGMSGGVDSSYVCHLAKKMNLNPLCVHFDNGWNSELAISNIEKLTTKCDFDLYTYVIDWDEFRDLQRAFFKAGVVDIEMLTDHAILATLTRLAKEMSIRVLLSGANYNTEHGIPRSWAWNKQDLKNIRAIHKKFGEVKLKTFPTVGFIKYGLIKAFNIGYEILEPLNFVNYTKQRAIDTLETVYEWRNYGGKHYESTFTKFYQGHVLVKKFNVDKRVAHLSCLIRTGEISKDEALAEIAKPIYSEKELIADLRYVTKKLGFDTTEFDDILNQSPIAHDFYRSDIKIIKFLKNIAIKYKTLR